MIKAMLALVALTGCTVGDQSQPVTVREQGVTAVVRAYCDHEAGCDAEIDWEECLSTNRYDVCAEVDCSEYMTPLEVDNMYECFRLLAGLPCDAPFPKECTLALGLITRPDPLPD